MYENFLDISEAAELTGYSVHTLYKKVERGEIPFRKLGRRNIFLREEVLDWMGGSTSVSGHGGREILGQLSDSLHELVGLVRGLEASGGLSPGIAGRLMESVESCLALAEKLSGGK